MAPYDRHRTSANGVGWGLVVCAQEAAFIKLVSKSVASLSVQRSTDPAPSRKNAVAFSANSRGPELSSGDEGVAIIRRLSLVGCGR
jgi:hypothetical protein